MRAYSLLSFVTAMVLAIASFSYNVMAFDSLQMYMHCDPGTTTGGVAQPVYLPVENGECLQVFVAAIGIPIRYRIVGPQVIFYPNENCTTLLNTRPGLTGGYVNKFEHVNCVLSPFGFYVRFVLHTGSVSLVRSMRYVNNDCTGGLVEKVYLPSGKCITGRTFSVAGSIISQTSFSNPADCTGSGTTIPIGQDGLCNGAKFILTIATLGSEALTTTPLTALAVSSMERTDVAQFIYCDTERVASAGGPQRWVLPFGECITVKMGGDGSPLHVRIMGPETAYYFADSTCSTLYGFSRKNASQCTDFNATNPYLQQYHIHGNATTFLIAYHTSGLCANPATETFYVATDGCYGGYSFYLANDDATLVQEQWVHENCTGPVSYLTIGVADGICAGGLTISRYQRSAAQVPEPALEPPANTTVIGSVLQWHTDCVLGAPGLGVPEQFVLPFGEGPKFCQVLKPFGVARLTARVLGDYLITFGTEQCNTVAGFQTFNYSECLYFSNTPGAKNNLFVRHDNVTSYRFDLFAAADCSGTPEDSSYVAFPGCYAGVEYYLASDNASLVQKHWENIDCTGNLSYSVISSSTNGTCIDGLKVAPYVPSFSAPVNIPTNPIVEINVTANETSVSFLRFQLAIIPETNAFSATCSPGSSMIDHRLQISGQCFNLLRLPASGYVPPNPLTIFYAQSNEASQQVFLNNFANAGGISQCPELESSLIIPTNGQCSNGFAAEWVTLAYNETVDLTLFLSTDCTGNEFSGAIYAYGTCYVTAFGISAKSIMIESDGEGGARINQFSGTICSGAAVESTFVSSNSTGCMDAQAAFGISSAGSALVNIRFVPRSPRYVPPEIVFGIIVGVVGIITVLGAVPVISAILGSILNPGTVLKVVEKAFEFIMGEPSLFLCTVSGVIAYVSQWIYLLTINFYTFELFYSSLFIFFVPGLAFLLVLTSFVGEGDEGLKSSMKRAASPLVTQVFVNFGYSIFPRASSYLNSFFGSPARINQDSAYLDVFYNSSMITILFFSATPQLILIIFNETYYDPTSAFASFIAVENLIATASAFIFGMYAVFKLLAKRKDSDSILRVPTLSSGQASSIKKIDIVNDVPSAQLKDV